jgi:hypothetical protein
MIGYLRSPFIVDSHDIRKIRKEPLVEFSIACSERFLWSVRSPVDRPLRAIGSGNQSDILAVPFPLLADH